MTINLSPKYQQDWIFDGDPNSSDLTLTQGGTLFKGDRGYDTSTTPWTWYICTDNGTFDGDSTISGSQWEKVTVTAPSE